MTDIPEKFSAKEFDDFLNAMNIAFYWSVCIPLLLFVFICLELGTKGGISPSFENDDAVWHPFVAAATVMISLPGFLIYKHKLKNLFKDLPLTTKLNAFKSAAFKKYFFLFLAAGLANLCLYIFQEQLFLLAFAVVLVMFSINRPTVYRLKKDLPLSDEERVSITEYRKYL